VLPFYANVELAERHFLPARVSVAQPAWQLCRKNANKCGVHAESALQMSR
jgi:hypothetical protein